MAARSPPRYAALPPASPVPPRLRRPPPRPGPVLVDDFSPDVGIQSHVGGWPTFDSVCKAVPARVAAAAASRRLVPSPVAPLPPPPPAARIPRALGHGLGTTTRQGGGQSAHLSRGAACRARRRAACPCAHVLLPPGSTRPHACLGSEPRLLGRPRPQAALPTAGSLPGSAARAPRRSACVLLPTPLPLLRVRPG